MKKVLFTATVDSHIENFHIPYLKYFKEQGYEVHVATNGDNEIPYCDKKIKISFERSPFKLKNLKAIRQLKKVIMEEKYDIIHTHTPMGSVVTRLAAAKARKKYHTRVIYTAHGFHFYKGAPKLNWILFYPVEKILSKITDTLITINSEDYELAKNKFWCKDVQYVPGVGIDENKFNIKMTKKEKSELRKSLGLKEDDFVMIYVARLDKNKNQGFLIEVTRELIITNPNVHLLLVGPDEYNGKYQEQAKDILSNVHFTGLRKDIPELLNISDVAVSSSLREGLPVNIMEALTVGLPVVATDARGVRDLVQDGVNGYVIKSKDIDSFNLKLNEIINKKKKTKIHYEFCLQEVLKKISSIYSIKHIKLSIIITVYNLESYINSCLDSIVSQDTNFSNLEIILIDDGSTDNSANICMQYVKKYSFIKYFYQKNNGVSSARNNGLNHTSGDYIYIIDGDDIMLPGSLNEIFSNLNWDYDVLQCNYLSFNSINKLKKKIKKFNLLNKISFDNHKKCLEETFSSNCINFALWANILKREVVLGKKINEKLKYTEDMDFVLGILFNSKEINFISKPTYGYRVNRFGSATSNVDEKRIDDMIYFINKWEKYNTNRNIKKYLNSFLAYQLLIAIGLSSKINNNKYDIIFKNKLYLLKNNYYLKVKIALTILNFFNYSVLKKALSFYVKLKWGR